MLLTPKMPPYSLTTSRSKDVQELILKPMIRSLTLPLKNSSPKTIMEFESLQHERPVFLTESQQ